MKQNLSPKSALLSVLIIGLTYCSVTAQLTTPSDGGNTKATVSEFISILKGSFQIFGSNQCHLCF